MYRFDVVVVGAGPAGGHCARLLAKLGYKTLLIERFKDFYRNNFSSAGAPLEILKQFDLPESIVGSFWNKFVIVTSNKKGIWESDTNQGSILDFAKLRQFLADEVKNHGGEVWMGCRYLNHSEQGDEIAIAIKNNLLNQEVKVFSKVLVDATGAARSITCRKGQQQPELIAGIGVEYLIKVDDKAYERNARALTFLMGSKWMPKGYSWVFPMEKNQLKVGAGVVKLNKQEKDLNPLKYYIDLLIKEYIKPHNYEIIDVHGEKIQYSPGLKDKYTEGRVIAIGDTVSTINLLGGEGIRHAMVSSEIATRYIDEFLKEKINNFDGYQKKMHSIFLTKWNISENFCKKTYIENPDTMVNKLVSVLTPMKLEDVVDILFYYKFEKISKGLKSYASRTFISKLNYSLSWISNFFTKKLQHK